MLPTNSSPRILKVFFQEFLKSESLMPVTQKSELQTKLGKFEVMSAIVDSGATVQMMNPHTGASYEIVSGSAICTECEIVGRM